METEALLEKWRHLIEPVIDESLSPLAWGEVLKLPVQVFEGSKSVLVTHPSALFGGKAWNVMVAAGDMDEVEQLEVKVIDAARAAGMKRLIYAGRRGWVRARGYREAAVVGVKEI